jgi:hypothetical protein
MSWTARIGIAVVALVISADVNAQMPSLNIMVGPTYASRETNSPTLESDPIVTIGGGGGFRFGMGTFAVEPGVVIVSKGTKQVAGDIETRLKLDYIEIPVLGIITLAPQSRVHPFISAGPVLSLEMRCRVERVEENSKEEIGCDLPNDATFDRHKVDLSLTGAVGAELLLSGSRRLSVQARYTHGMRNISDAEDATVDVRNRAFSFYIGFMLPLKPDF